MAGICSRHPEYEATCAACNGTPWELLGTTQDDWEAHCREAESEGLMSCPLCVFPAMYRRACRQPDGRYMCPRCGRYFTEVAS